MTLVIVATLALVACAAAAPAGPVTPAVRGTPVAPVVPVAAGAAVAPAAPAAPIAPVGPVGPVASDASAERVQQPVPIIKSQFDQQENGQYSYSFETADGVSKQETGEVRSLTNDENEPVDVVVSRGSYSFTDPEGVKHTVTYFADETGFHAEYEPKL